MWNHWVVRASTPFQPFNDFETSRRTWESLMKTFPKMIGAILMPNHGHFILPQEKKDTSTFHQLCGILGQISKEKKILGYWQPIPSPSVIPDKHHLKRQLRYVALNPCRKGLCRDPLEWYWSTYRELFGATVHRINNSQALENALGDAQPDFLDRFHSYVSGDPSVAVYGTPPPTPDHPQTYAYKAIDEILAASAAALRVLPSTVKERGALRALFIHLAYQHGWRFRTSLLAEICGISPRAVRFILKRPIPKGVDAAHLCLSDARLRPTRVTQDFTVIKRDVLS
jgi:hypothetical protein